MKFNVDHHLKNITLVFQEGGVAVDVPGKLVCVNGRFYFCSSNPAYHLNAPPMPVPGYPHCMQLIGNTSQSFMSTHGNMISVKFDENIIYMKASNQGTLFRKIYKIDNPLIYMGPVQKDIEECYKPAPVITVFDKEFIDRQGWAEYEKEPSAEEKVKRAVRPQ